MDKRIKILVVCGFGVGTSLILKMNIEKVLKQNGINAEVENTDITTAPSVHADMIFTSNELANTLKSKTNKPIVVINNFLSNGEIEEKGIPVIREIIG